jgi:hypothetical protein
MFILCVELSPLYIFSNIVIIFFATSFFFYWKLSLQVSFHFWVGGVIIPNIRTIMLTHRVLAEATECQVGVRQTIHKCMDGPRLGNMWTVLSLPTIMLYERVLIVTQWNIDFETKQTCFSYPPLNPKTRIHSP